MTEPVHIHVNHNEDKVQETSTKSEQYIINNNKELSASILALRNEMHEIKTERDEFEEQADKGEKSTQYMRGLLKNLVAINISFEKIEGFYHDETKYLREKIKNLKTHLYFTLFMQILGFICLFLFNKYVFLLFWSGNIIMISNVIKDTQNKINRQKIRREKLEIKKVKDACDFLHNYIDNL